MNMADGYTGVEISDSRSEGRMERNMMLSLFPTNRPRNSSKSSSTTLSSPVSPIDHQLSPLPLSSRESLPVNRQRPFTSSHHPGVAEGRSVSNPIQTRPLHRKPSEASRLRAMNNGSRAPSTDRRISPERNGFDPQIAENFSRPRQPSVRRRKDSPLPKLPNASSPSQHPQYEMAAQPDPPFSRDRGFSTSSSHSATHLPSYPLRPSTSIPDYQTPESIYSRQRNLNNSTYRPSRGMSRPDSNYSAHRKDPISRPGQDAEEVRASFRSALTTNSSFLGTSGTERSSVLTKSSSATSIFGRDEGMSVDDAIGMYEQGFADSGVEDDYEEDTRPATASSEHKRIEKLEEAMNDTLLVPPTIGGVYVRDSAAIFKYGDRDTPSLREMDGSDTTSLRAQEKIASSRPVMRAAEPPFNSSRDRYGFLKKTQYVPLDQYEAWNGPYTEYLARRRKKWVALMKDNSLSADKPTQFPTKSVKVKRFVRKGIPPDWRGAAWFFYAGGPEMLDKHPGEYADLVNRAVNGGVSQTDDEIIERDLHRTFPDNVKFKPDVPPGQSRDSHQVEPETPLLQSLRRVLQAFSIQNPRIGYCQSLNFLAGLLLLFMSEEHSFWMLNIITRVYLPGTHELNLEGANVDLGVLMNSIRDMMPSIWAKIGGELDGSVSAPNSTLRLPPITLCTTAWFMSCFIGNLPVESTLRVWDCFFFEGSKTLFRIALTVFKLGEQEIKAVSDPMEIFQVVQCIPRKLIDCNTLIETCFKRRNGFGHLSQEAIEKGRAERRRGYAEEREKAANGDVIPATTPGMGRKGTVKKGTLFGRRGRRVAVEA